MRVAEGSHAVYFCLYRAPERNSVCVSGWWSMCVDSWMGARCTAYTQERQQFSRLASAKHRNSYIKHLKINIQLYVIYIIYSYIRHT